MFSAVTLTAQLHKKRTHPDILTYNFLTFSCYPTIRAECSTTHNDIPVAMQNYASVKEIHGNVVEQLRSTAEGNELSLRKALRNLAEDFVG